MDANDMTQKQAEMLAALDGVQELAGLDGHVLTRDEQDSIFYLAQALKERINEIYRKKVRDGR